MSLSFGGKSSKSKTNSTSQNDPWEETIPYLKEFLGKLGGVSASTPTGPTPTQIDAFGQLKDIAGAGNPYAGQIDDLANDLFGTQSQAPMAKGSYEDLTRRLTPTAEGENLDIMNDPQLAKLLQFVGDDAANRINSQFAGAGRDMSGINQQLVARGVGQAQLPILTDQLNREKGRTDAAARDLYGAGQGTAQNIANLDKIKATLQQAGIDVGKEALDAKAWGPEALINLEEQMKNLPYEQLQKIAELLFPAAGLGGQQQGWSSTKGSQVGAGASFKL